LLGDIPVIGNAFSRWEDGGASSETVVVITPRIIRDAEAASDKPSARLQEAEPPLLRSAMKLEHTLEHLRPLD
jgi:type II secretory pathway component GspD/PulD (secretin)